MCRLLYYGGKTAKTFFSGDNDEKNVGMEGCAACGRMEDVTYADSEVINIINEHFVAIEVDAEARPDIGERFSRTGYLGTGELTAEMT